MKINTADMVFEGLLRPDLGPGQARAGPGLGPCKVYAYVYAYVYVYVDVYVYAVSYTHLTLPTSDLV